MTYRPEPKPVGKCRTQQGTIIIDTTNYTLADTVIDALLLKGFDVEWREAYQISPGSRELHVFRTEERRLDNGEITSYKR